MAIKPRLVSVEQMKGYSTRRELKCGFGKSCGGTLGYLDVDADFSGSPPFSPRATWTLPPEFRRAPDGPWELPLYRAEDGTLKPRARRRDEQHPQLPASARCPRDRQRNEVTADGLLELLREQWNVTRIMAMNYAALFSGMWAAPQSLLDAVKRGDWDAAIRDHVDLISTDVDSLRLATD